jgi:cell division topological specificity factor
MASFFERVWGRSNRTSSAKEAKDRLQFILFHDRIDLPPEQLENMKAEILAVISKYVAIETERVDIALQQRQRDNFIIAEIPFSKPAEGIEDNLLEALDEDENESSE